MPSNGKQPEGQDDGIQSNVPAAMLKQAEAAATNANDPQHAQEKHQAGRDVPTIQHSDTITTEVDVPPPAYGDVYGSIKEEQDGFGTKATMSNDGRVNITIDQRSKKLSSMLVPALRHQQDMAGQEKPPPAAYIPPSLGGKEGVPAPPPMNVVIHVVGSRGDVQPFVALGKVLKETYGHRVRLATHPVFQKFVSENGLEFFSIGGDPAELMAFMVKNPGLMPGFDTLRSGDVGKRRKEIATMIRGCWRSCYEAGNGMGPAASDKNMEDFSESDAEHKPFVADAIIANPPSFAHIHCAEKLGIPLHVMFTMPYSPTQAFPHPLANIQSTNADPHLTNYMSYAIVDMMTWQGLGDLINELRTKYLGLDEISLMWAPGMLQRLRIPHTYCWSPALIPKPKDWGSQVSISGFYFLNLATNFTPEPDLKAFLDAGPPPVYIGFGSIVLDDPNAMTKLIFEAVEKTGQRALVSKGWGGMGADEMGVPDSVFMLGNVPHDWLFQHVSCVVHHGGAGTTAAGITAGKPTLVVPFFGDQPFWGSMVHRAGAGPEPIPHKQLTADKLAEGINVCLKPQSLERAHELAEKISHERGSDTGAQSFHQFLDIDNLRCSLAPWRAAVWRLKRTQVRLSAMAACTLANEGLLDFNELKLFRAREYESDDGPWDPISGGATALIGTVGTMMMGVADFPIDTLKALKIHPDAAKKKKEPNQAERDDEHKESPPSISGKASQASPPDDGSRSTTPTRSRTGSTFNLQESLARIQTPTSPSGSGSSMASALRGRLSESGNNQRSGSSRSRSGSGSRPRTPRDPNGTMETAIGTTKGVQKIVGAGFKSPMDFTMSLAKGFHNAPKLYGDESVRKSEQVTDFRSGLKAAGKTFGYGMFDGITGLVSQPMKGAQKEGAAGFVKGFGKGIGGIVLKPGAAIFGIPGYTMKGVYKELQALMGSSVQNYIIAARTAQGYEEWSGASAEERADVVRRWKTLQQGLKKKKNPDELVKEIFEESRRKKQLWLEQRRNEHGDRPLSRSSSLRRSLSRRRRQGEGNQSPRASTEHSRLSVEQSRSSAEQAGPAHEHEELEEAIALSVRETSRGDPEEDAAIERAIRASMNELTRSRSKQSAPTAASTDDDEQMRQAMAASMQQPESSNQPPEMDEELERALAASLREQRRKRGGDSEWDSEPDTEDDEEFKQAVKASAQGGKDAGHVSGVTREEFEQGGGEKGKSAQELDEERVVMEYVKKQSLLEDEAKKKGESSRGGGGLTTDGGVEDEDEEFERAMKISMQDHEGGGK